MYQNVYANIWVFHKKRSKIITCHIGNGGSIAAVKDGKCIDTTMGLTPLEGLMMGTRCGDIDGGAITYIMKKKALHLMKCLLC